MISFEITTMRLRRKAPRNPRLDDPDFIWDDGKSHSDRLAVAQIETYQAEEVEDELVSVTESGDSGTETPPPKNQVIIIVGQNTEMTNHAKGVKRPGAAAVESPTTVAKKVKRCLRCPECLLTFDNTQTYIQHRKIGSCHQLPPRVGVQQQQQQVKRCAMCDFSTADNITLLTHIKQVHVPRNQPTGHYVNPAAAQARPIVVPLKKPLPGGVVNNSQGAVKPLRQSKVAEAVANKAIDIRCNFCPESNRPTFTNPGDCQNHYVEHHKATTCPTCKVGINGAAALRKHACHQPVRQPTKEDVTAAAYALASMASAAPVVKPTSSLAAATQSVNVSTAGKNCPDENVPAGADTGRAALDETYPRTQPAFARKNCRAETKKPVDKKPKAPRRQASASKQVFRCNQCEFVSKQGARLSYHFDAFHASHVCPLCGPSAQFVGKRSLAVHLSDAHGVNASITPRPDLPPAPQAAQKLQCPHCPVICPTHALLNEHMRFTHKQQLQQLAADPSSPPLLEVRRPQPAKRLTPPKIEGSSMSGPSTGFKGKKSPLPPAETPTCDLLKKYYEEHEQDDLEPYYQRGFNAQATEQAFDRAMNLYFRPNAENCIALNTHQYLAVWER